MKINIVRGILIIFLIGIFSMIFGFSNQNGTKSSKTSEKVTILITKNVKSIQNKPVDEKEKIIFYIEGIVRKIAHFTIYMIVGILIRTLCQTYKIHEIDKFSISIITGIIYATADEIHQAFIPGRSSMFIDVLIDTMGTTTGILIIMIIIEICEKINLNKDNHKYLVN